MPLSWGGSSTARVFLPLCPESACQTGLPRSSVALPRTPGHVPLPIPSRVLKQKREIRAQEQGCPGGPRNHTKQAPPWACYALSFENHQKTHPTLPFAHRVLSSFQQSLRLPSLGEKRILEIFSHGMSPLFLPGESQGRGSLVGCRLWGRNLWTTREVSLSSFSNQLIVQETR